jgi:hypothetical protein
MMIQSSDSAVNLLAEDDFGIVYFIESPQQFWSGTFYTQMPLIPRILSEKAHRIIPRKPWDHFRAG